ncbi:hypothetical protein Emag_006358 [Eimeria magna]
MQTVRAEDQGVGDVGYKEISFGLRVFVAPPVVRDILRNRAHLERRASGYGELHRLIQRLCSYFRLDSYAGTLASPTLWEGPNFSDFRGYSQESAFAVLRGPGWVMRSGEPCWLVVCSLRDVYREMVYDRAMREIFSRHCLRRFVEIPPRLCPRNMDMEYSYAVAPCRVESNAQLTEDYARRPPAYEPLGPLAPSVASSVMSKISERGGVRSRSQSLLRP